jgi:hypothetical protein
MQNSFFQKLLMTMLAGFVAAGLHYLFRHVINQAIYESGEGWKEIYISTPKPKPR